MYCANVRASLPVSMDLPATLVVGRAIDSDSPPFFASAAIADGVMSGVPTMYSCLRLLLTVLWPLKLITTVVIPSAIRTAAAITPPSSKILRIFSTSWWLAVLRLLDGDID